MADIISKTFYDRDFYAWTSEQAGLLCAGRLSELDREMIAEEIESLGRTEKRELVSHLKILLIHLLKGQHQPGHRGGSWRSSIQNARDSLADLLTDSPSLKSQLAAASAPAYERARRDAEAETGSDLAIFPPACPWSMAQILAHEFWPASS